MKLILYFLLSSLLCSPHDSGEWWLLPLMWTTWDTRLALYCFTNLRAIKTVWEKLGLRLVSNNHHHFMLLLTHKCSITQLPAVPSPLDMHLWTESLMEGCVLCVHRGPLLRHCVLLLASRRRTGNRDNISRELEHKQDRVYYVQGFLWLDSDVVMSW